MRESLDHEPSPAADAETSIYCRAVAALFAAFALGCGCGAWLAVSLTR